MAILPTDLIAIILSKLPVKILLRFLSVCKSWNSLIKTPNFIKLHLNQTLISNSERHLLLYYPFLYSAELDTHHDQITFSELHHPLNPQQVHLFGSCNGVICIADPSKTDIVLFNPIIKSYRNLPVNQISEPNLGYMLFGFGYDSKNDDYKVLCLVQGFTANQVFFTEAKLYSLNNNSWKSVQGISFYILYADCHGILVNEALHYMVNSNEVGGLEGKFIAKFDLQTESFSLIDCPKLVDESESNLMIQITELGGCLCAMVNYHKVIILDGLKRVDFWVMKEYGNKESWVKLCSIGQDCIRSNLQIKPIVYSKDGKRIFLEIDSLKFGWYDLESNNVDKFTPHGLPGGALETASFVGSLVLIGNELCSEKETLPKKKKWLRRRLEPYLL
ncbi:F-box protein CPR30-like isoform X2 [Chenopodium quinoa]|uniref:F-box protein CPR30-like isoform X2 n=1 Tax=Chenopodium quinoa TaxID=63459 RepID=UPI000B78DF07|nr:F-box protein CPR30-like isoform X2 [Chenopodium quinoa]